MQNLTNKLNEEFKKKGLDYNNSEVFLRSFKALNEMEIWVKNNNADTFTLFKKYNVCALSGVLGPKRAERRPQNCRRCILSQTLIQRTILSFHVCQLSQLLRFDFWKSDKTWRRYLYPWWLFHYWLPPYD